MRFRRVLVSLAVATAMVATALLPGSQPARASTVARIDARLQSVMATATGPVQVIVTFAGEGAPTAADVDLLRQVGITTGRTLQSLPMAGVLATRAQINALAANPEVRSIYYNAPLRYYDAGANAATGVDRVRSDGTMTALNNGQPVTGRGVGVVVNDSGVDGTHGDLQLGQNLKQNVLGSTKLLAVSGLVPISYVEGVPNTDSNSGHGTHVAGIVGGTGAMSAGTYEGVAPGASLVGYGTGATLLVLDGVGGFDYAITHKETYGIRVVTNSWGSSAAPFDPEDPINLASYAAYKQNMVVTFAAGNDGPAADTLNPYAKAPWVIAVAAGDKQGNLADFSSRGVDGRTGTFTKDGQTWTWEDHPTVTAPGVDIISTRAVGPVPLLGASKDASLIEPTYLPFYTAMSGTSMATPHVAGIVALMLEANPGLSPLQVKQFLTETATPMPGRAVWEVGAGYANAYAAVDRAFQAR
jgi:serine protease AprX